MKKYIYILFAALLASSCIYEFTPEGGKAEKRLVIEGDIVLGGESKFDISYTVPIGSYENEEDEIVIAPYGEGWIEASDGTIYKDSRDNFHGSSFTINTESASENLRYRFHFDDITNGRSYISRWQEVAPQPEIEKVYVDYDDWSVYVRMDVNGFDNAYFRWNYEENWEIHAQYAPMYYFDVENERVVENENSMQDFSLYYCWKRFKPSIFGLAQTEKQNENKMQGRIIASYERTDDRFQLMYRMDLEVTGITKDAYNYLNNMLEISDISGSLFSPSPDDTRGNIVCQQDSTEFVIGYVSVVKPVKKRFQVFQGENLFYRLGYYYTLAEPKLEEGQTLLDYYNMDNRPVQEISGESEQTVGWGPRRCIDCTALGGDKNKPADWPRRDE